MATVLGVLEDAGPRGKSVTATRFSGGRTAGICLQLTQEMENGSIGYIQMTANDLLCLVDAVQDSVVIAEYERRASICSDIIKKNRELEKSIISEMRNVSKLMIERFSGSSLVGALFGSKFTPNFEESD